jgi:hypothetical protein
MKTICHIQKIKKTGRISLYFTKSLFFIFFLLCLVQASYSQADSINSCADSSGRNENIEPGDKSKILRDNKKGDTTIVETENRLYIFIKRPDGFIIDRIDLTTGEKKRVLDLGCEEIKATKKDSDRFRGHWSGIVFGINGFMNSEFMLKSPTGYGYFDLNTWRSWSVNINFAQFSVPLIKNNFGLVTGLGLELNNYFFRHYNNIQLNKITGVIEEWDVKNEYDNIRKSKFTTTYLTLPLMMEYQVRGTGKRLFYMSGGVIGGWNIHSARKIKYEVDGNKQKLTIRGGRLNINDLRVGATFQIGSRDKSGLSSGLYATYYFTPLFETDKGPELYPVEAGFRFDF